MLRKSIVVGRRPFGPLSAVKLRKHEPSLFVCTSCQARAMATTRNVRAKRSKPKSEPFMAAIERLEAHVQQMERNYVDELRKRAVKKIVTESDVSEDMQDQAYAALMTPPPEAAFLPKPVELVQRLPVLIRNRLGVGLRLVQSNEPQWHAVLTQLEVNGGLKGLAASHVNALLSCMDILQRAEATPRIMEMMRAAGVQPNTFTYDLVMMANAGVGNSAQVKALFKEMRERELPPTVYSYGHLLKAYSQEQDVASAAAAFQEMQAAGIESNLIVYTTLIQTCIARKEFGTAWQIFNLIKLKSTATAPDASTYALMIHACAHAGETERALDLHTDMTKRKGIPPTTETYHALLHACAMRKDYFNEAWRIATEMQSSGFEINRMTLNVLIQACGKVGELVRARLLVRHMMGSGVEDLAPDKWTYQNLLRAYANYHAPSNCRGKFRKHQTDQKTIDADKAAFVQPETVLQKRGPDSAPEEIPFLAKSVLQNAREVVDEAALIVNWLRDTHPELVDTQTLNAFLDICLAQSSFSDLKWSYENDLENPTGPLSPPPSPTAAFDLPKLPRNIYSYRSALQAAVKFRNLPFARKVWEDRLAFLRTPDYLHIQSAERNKRNFESERDMVHVLALTGQMQECRERIRILAEEAGVWWRWDDLKTVYIRAVQTEDAVTAGFVRRFVKRESWEDADVDEEEGF